MQQWLCYAASALRYQINPHAGSLICRFGYMPKILKNKFPWGISKRLAVVVCSYVKVDAYFIVCLIAQLQ